MAKKAMQEGMQADLRTGLEVERLCYAQVNAVVGGETAVCVDMCGCGFGSITNAAIA